MKKLLIIGSIVVVIFALLIFLNKASNNAKLENNLYGTNDLKQETIDQLDDENYQNIILPDALKKKIDSGEPIMAYFFSPICSHCQAFTPVLMPLAKEANITIHQYNVYEFEDGWNDYKIEATPTLVYFKDGKEVARLMGNNPEQDVIKFFESTILK